MFTGIITVSHFPHWQVVVIQRKTTKELDVLSPALRQLHCQLGIPADYSQVCAMRLQEECVKLVQAEPDVFGREVWLEASALQAWIAMRLAADAAGISLKLVSAFRSYDYQANLIQRKLTAGQSITDILTVNAAPGYSEHHTGKALDLGCDGSPYLEECFEQTSAFAWLQAHAASFQFRLSFPRNNPYGVLYEPWHWFYNGE